MSGRGSGAGLLNDVQQYAIDRPRVLLPPRMCATRPSPSGAYYDGLGWNPAGR